MKEIVPETLFIDYDNHGEAFYIIKDRFKNMGEIEVGWSDTDRCLLISQISPNPHVADCLELSLGQAYDLLTVISMALDIPVRLA